MEGAPGVSTRILFAAGELVDIAAYFHPDLRGRQAFDTALSAPFVGITHKERVWMALALYCRYQGRNAPLPNEQAISLLDWDEQQSATQAGLAMRFVATLAPKSPGLLDDCRLEKKGVDIIFTAPADSEALFGETPRKRFESLASSFEANPVLNFKA
jgi:exopolyphosphatase/guanosine-5'-triphosphate,3'-diphosphate pyrophosphatase